MKATDHGFETFPYKVILKYIDIDFKDERKTVVAAFPVTAGAMSCCFSWLLTASWCETGQSHAIAIALGETFCYMRDSAQLVLVAADEGVFGARVHTFAISSLKAGPSF